MSPKILPKGPIKYGALSNGNVWLLIFDDIERPSRDAEFYECEKGQQPSLRMAYDGREWKRVTLHELSKVATYVPAA